MRRAGFPTAPTFDGVSGLRAALLRRPELFVGTLTEKLLTYGLGRGLEYYDAPAVRAIVRNAQAQDYRFSSLVLGIVTQRSVSDEDVAMIRHQGSTATAHVPARDGRDAGAAAARRDGAGALGAGADDRQLGAAAGLRLHPDGDERGGMDAGDAGPHHRAVAVAARADAGARSHHRGDRTSSCATPTPPAITPRPTARS